MSDNTEAPQTILEQILNEMFQKLEKEDAFNKETLEELRNLSKSDVLIKGSNILDLLKQGDAGEDP